MTTNSRVEKLALNNQIVSMRKEVKRARLWMINNLNQQVKRLKNKKGSKEEIEKHFLKAARLRNEIQLLKNTNIDEVSKFALCKKPDFQLDDSQFDASQKMLLKLSNHKIVKEQVLSFYKHYPSIPNDKLIILVRSLGSHNQKKKASKCKTNKVCSSERSIDSTVSNEMKTSEMKPLLKQLKTSSGTTNPEVSFPSEESLSSYPGQNKSENQNAKSLSEAELRKDKILKRKESPLKMLLPKLSDPQINKLEGSMEIKVLNLDDCVADIIPLSETKKVTSNYQRVELPSDSFFLGGIDVPSECDVKTDSHSLSLSNRSKAKESVRGSNLIFQHKDLQQQSKSQRNSTLITNKHISDMETGALHPSWQAKRKEKELKINLVGSFGKKIKFD